MCENWKRKPQIPPLRFAPVGMTIHLSAAALVAGGKNCRSLGFARDDKGKGDRSVESGCRTEAFFITLGGPKAHDSSGRDDNSVAAKVSHFLETRNSILKPNCHLDRTRISCHAALDMATCAAFVKESSMKFPSATKSHRKSGGAQRSGGICGFLF